ncbi:hypothetical protein PUN28_018895 [Cardiocondyla obscurior]|uniref:Secreted protein n=1 Tax=Cardiocondyla obscurior TaxID=286306 RepID=A0AAW2ECG9_9HYME
MLQVVVQLFFFFFFRFSLTSPRFSMACITDESPRGNGRKKSGRLYGGSVEGVQERDEREEDRIARGERGRLRKHFRIRCGDARASARKEYEPNVAHFSVL